MDGAGGPGPGAPPLPGPGAGRRPPLLFGKGEQVLDGVGQCGGAEPDAPARLVDAAARHFGALDVLVNSAAVMERTPVGEVTPAEWDALRAGEITPLLRQLVQTMLDWQPPASR